MLRSSVHLWAGKALALLALGASTLSVAGPATIDYELIALATPGRYEYRYTVTNVSLAAPLSWFSIDFASALYDESSLSITSAGLGDWSQQILGSIPILGVPAQYDAFRTTGSPLGTGATQAGFSVQFTWLGAATPGVQAFTVYDPTSLNVLDTGFTTLLPSVPEPSTTALALLGLCCVLAAYRRSAIPLPWLGAARTS